MAKLKITFEEDGLEPREITVSKGTNILEAVEDNGMHLNSNCGGVCACSTCHVYINAGEKYLEEITDREEDFVDRAINPRIESRLGCQCFILDEEAEIEVEIPDQSLIIGHEH